MTQPTSPLVYVCVPVYNAALTLERSLASIIGQSYKNILVLVIDNASTDSSLDIARAFAKRDERVKVFANAENVGGEGNFTRCVQAAGGDYTAIYHADDIYEPTMVAESVAFLEQHRNAGAVFTAARRIDADGNVVGHNEVPADLLALRKEVYSFEEIFRSLLRNGNFFIFPSAMVRTSIYKDEIKAWDGARYKTSADLDVWLRIGERHGLGILNKPLIRYRVSVSSFSYNYARLRAVRQDLFLVLDAYVRKYTGTLVREREMADYQLLALKDDINVAVNFLIKGDGKGSRTHLMGIFKLRNIARSISDFKRFRFLLAGYMALLLSFVPLSPGMRELVARVRHGK